MDGAKPITEETSFVAQYTSAPRTFTVTFTMDDTTLIERVENVEYGTELSEIAPTPPEKDGSTFDCWTVVGVRVNDSFTIATDTEIVAQYKEVDLGTLTLANMTVYNEFSYKIPTVFSSGVERDLTYTYSSSAFTISPEGYIQASQAFSAVTVTPTCKRPSP